MRDYQESVTTRQTHRHTDGQTDGRADAGQSDPNVPLCFAGDTKTVLSMLMHGYHQTEDKPHITQHLHLPNAKDDNLSRVSSKVVSYTDIFIAVADIVATE